MKKINTRTIELHPCSESNIFDDAEMDDYLLASYLCPKEMDLDITANEIANEYSTLDFKLKLCDSTVPENNCKSKEEIQRAIDESFINIAFRN